MEYRTKRFGTSPKTATPFVSRRSALKKHNPLHHQNQRMEVFRAINHTVLSPGQPDDNAPYYLCRIPEYVKKEANKLCSNLLKNVADDEDYNFKRVSYIARGGTEFLYQTKWFEPEYSRFELEDHQRIDPSSILKDRWVFNSPLLHRVASTK